MSAKCQAPNECECSNCAPLGYRAGYYVYQAYLYANGDVAAYRVIGPATIRDCDRTMEGIRDLLGEECICDIPINDGAIEEGDEVIGVGYLMDWQTERRPGRVPRARTKILRPWVATRR